MLLLMRIKLLRTPSISYTSLGSPNGKVSSSTCAVCAALGDTRMQGCAGELAAWISDYWGPRARDR